MSADLNGIVLCLFCSCGTRFVPVGAGWVCPHCEHSCAVRWCRSCRTLRGCDLGSLLRRFLRAVSA